jgi:cytochrome c-type biogenesis protein
MGKDTVFLNSVFFVIGFGLVFSVLGIAFQTALSHTSISIMNDLRVVGGVIIIGFGALIMLSSKYIIPFFSTGHKIKVKQYKSSFLTSLVFGIAFALGWTPCVGAILGSIYILAATSPGIGFLLLLSFSLGLGIPFLVVGAFVSEMSNFLKKIRPFLKYFNIVSGVFLIAIGLLVVTDNIGILGIFFLSPGGAGGGASNLNFIIAIAAGVLTFFSPCILPLLPAYFSYMAGRSAEEAS